MDVTQLLSLLRLRCEQRFANPRALFRTFDLDRASRLTRKQMTDGVATVTGVTMDDSLANEFYNFFDLDGDGQVSYSDWISVFERKETEIVRPASAVGAVTTPSRAAVAGTVNSPGLKLAAASGAASPTGSRIFPTGSPARPASAGPSSARTPRDVEPPRPGEPQLGDMLKKLRDTLARRGTTTIARLGKAFNIIDDDGSKSIDIPEFKKVLREYGIELSNTEFEVLRRHFDRNNDGVISYDEFLFAIRGELNARRRDAVWRAFKILDTNGNGVIELDDIQAKYNAAGHPDVRAGRKTEAQVLREFLDTFDAGEKDGQVHLDEFEEYYSAISASIDTDDYFEQMMDSAWNMQHTHTKRQQGRRANEQAEAAASAAARSGRRAQPTGRAPLAVLEVLENIRQAMKRRGTFDIASLGRAFKIFDDDNSGTLSVDEFAKAMSERGIDLYDSELTEIMRYFDRNGDGFINYDELLLGLRGDLNDRRKKAVREAYARLDYDNSGEVDMRDIVGRYNAAANPEVRAGKKTEQQVLREFLDNFDQGQKDGVVTLEEFEKYYANVSCSIDSDDYFEAVLESSWRDRSNQRRGVAF